MAKRKQLTQVKNENATVAATVMPDVSQLLDRIDELEAEVNRRVPMVLQYQQSIEAPPVQKEALHSTACNGDGVTASSWRKQWLDQIKANAAMYDFKANSVMSEFAKFAYKPCIVAGSGPSLKKNASWLKERGGIGLVSCLHNFGYFEDIGVKPDYYMNLDAGDITIPEVYQGGKRAEEEYWEATKDYTLVTVISGNPTLHKKWRGKILFFMTVIPDKAFIDEMREITDFNVAFNVGGNALGACYYMARAVLGAQPVAFVGADFSFDYTHKFHPFDSPYDAQFSGVMPATDVFGNRVYTWPSYYGFKCWFDWQALGGSGNNPGLMINCTEGGIFGAYAEGNIRQVLQMRLEEFLRMYRLHEMLPNVINDTSVSLYNLIF